MKVVFINGKRIPFPTWICNRWKTLETRQRNMLSALIGERVAIAETGTHRYPVIVGYADMVGSFFCAAEDFGKYRDQHMVPAGSEFDVKGRGKWCYILENAEHCTPYPLPSSAVRHGRSWADI